MEKKTLLWIGDAGCESGFGRATHNIVPGLLPSFTPTVLGLNYNGDPNRRPYDIYAAMAGGDGFGIRRIVWMCDKIEQETGAPPDVIVIQNDPWNIPLYLKALEIKGPNYDGSYAKIPVIGIVAVDGKNCRGAGLNGLTLAIFWTQFGLDEARAGGYTGPGIVIPLGVDLSKYYPMDKYEARQIRNFPKEIDDSFLVGAVNRNQDRKRWDLTIEYFAKWMHSGRLKDAYLFLHTAPTGDKGGADVMALASYWGVGGRVAVYESSNLFHGITEDEMRATYNCFDVQITTTLGEGFGLTTFEGAACGVAQIVPAWAALGELMEGAGRLVPCTSYSANEVSVIGGVADRAMFIREMETLYTNRAVREQVAADCLARAREDRFRWETIGEAYRLSIELMLQKSTDVVELEETA